MHFKKNYLRRKDKGMIFDKDTHCQNIALSPEFYYQWRGKRSELSQQCVRIPGNKIPGALVY